MTSFRCSIVNTALSRVVAEIFNVEKYPDLQIPVRVNKSAVTLKTRLGVVNVNETVTVR